MAMAKLNRAKEHINNLKVEFDAFLAKDPYKFSIKYDEHRTHGTIIVRVRAEAPILRWSVFIGDAIHNLRSALDHLVCQLVLTGKSQIARQQFPIYRTAHAYNSSKRADVKGVCPRAEQIIDRLKPHGEGIKSYWRLSQVDNYDKHRLLIAAVDTPSNMIFKPSSAWKRLIDPSTLILYKIPNPIKDNTKFLSFPIPPEARDENLDPDGLDVTWDIRLLTPPEVENEFISTVFYEFNCTVEKTIRILSRLL